LRWYDYIFVLSLCFLVFSANYYLTRNTAPPIKAIDLVSIVEEKRNSILSSDRTTKEKLREFDDFLNRLDKILTREEGVIVIKQVIVGGNSYEDITERVRKLLNKKE